MATRQSADNAGHASVKTALRVIEIIEIYAQEGRSLTLTELSRLLDAPMSSCLGLIRTLVSRGYLYETGKRQGYYPTARLLHTAQRIARNDPVLERMQPVMESLRDATGETVVFGQLQDQSVRYLDVCESANPVRYITAPGDLREPHINSIGRAILGASSDQARDQVLDKLSFASSAASREMLASQLRQWREQGWYPNFGESFADLGGIAIPILIGDALYGLSVAGPLYRVQPRAAEIVAALHAAARRLGSHAPRAAESLAQSQESSV
ncbi:IclR family transcriptional regulator [Bordetella sp. FB-8]|uniref:IclR family transcriptional regulator n=1 Tax=Bordetella sp. FB-8 TaxID=1159870 RepID=UPI000362B9A5|nr:IclR family transcriptional regulator C-terminal domain-containing protein [Bordetella sp. FB-8]